MDYQSILWNLAALERQLREKGYRNAAVEIWLRTQPGRNSAIWMDTGGPKTLGIHYKSNLQTVPVKGDDLLAAFAEARALIDASPNDPAHDMAPEMDYRILAEFEARRAAEAG